jgi:UrcA family protein
MRASHLPVARIAAVALIAAAATLPVTPVRAASGGDERPSITLYFSARDLHTSQGVAGLYRRIRGAAATVCSPFDSPGVAEKQRRDKCFNQAVAQAVQSIHNGNLTAYHWHQIRGLKWPWMQAPTALAER